MTPSPTQQLLGLLFITGAVAIGGSTFVAFVVKPGTTRAELLDAGVLQFCSPQVLRCQVRVADECRPLPGGGYRPRYGTLETQVLRCPNDAGPDGLLFRWPRSGGRDCFEVAGTPSTACTLVDDCAGGGTDCAEDSSGQQPVRAVQNRCACRQPDAGLCRVANPDGGTAILATLGVTLAGGTFVGPGCTRAVCEELNGDQGLGWPDGCPQ